MSHAQVRQGLTAEAGWRPRLQRAAGPGILLLWLLVPLAGAAVSRPLPTLASTVPGEPRFTNYPSPAGVADDAGEPSIGLNWTTEQSFSNSAGSIPNGGTVNYFGGFLPYMLKVTFDDCSSPARAIWDQKPLLTASTTRVFGDPILYTDRLTGRTLVSQEEGLSPLGSTTDITDDDGDTFQPSQGSGAPSCVDHQTLGGGPFHAPLSSPLYPNAIYYASQCVADAVISLSLDGGITFAPSVPMYTVADCDGLHGHVKVGPDGTVFVPNKACSGSVPLLNGGEVSVVVSEDNGLTWAIRPVPGSATKEDDDPSVGVAADGSIYLGWQSSDGHPRIAVSHDKGLTWMNVRDVGASVGVVNCAFPAVVAGDGGVTTGRAAFAFYGTTTAGANYDQPEFTGDWYLYIATTFDGGNTWTTQNVTPGDPIQRASGICGDGTCRNMLDFFDAGIDKQGRVLVGWDDGCVGGCVDGGPNSFSAKAVITRQSGGRRMFAACDPVEPRRAEAPGLRASQAGAVVRLEWDAPDNGGDAITGYRIYRKVGAAPFTLVATQPGTGYVDTVNPGDALAYRVTAVNALGEGPYCHDVVPASGPVASACEIPGLLAVNDLNANGTDNDSGQNTPLDPGVNVRSLSVAEPYAGPAVNQLTFTLQVAPSTGAPPASSQWYIIWNRRSVAADGSDRRFVAVKTDLSGAPSYVYGDFGPPLPLDGSIPALNANTPTPLGAADFGSYDAARGVITIRLSAAHADGTPLVAGNELTNLNVRTYLARPDAGQKAQNNASDITSDGTYRLVGNAACFCAVNEPPVASVTATPTSGGVPLTVNFDASGSQDPNTADGDGVASYTFTFGDGSSPVTQSGPTIAHTYTVPSSSSGYFATVTVKDQKCALQSLNVASTNITATSGTSAVPLPPPPAFQLTPVSNPARGALDLMLSLDRGTRVHVGVFSVAGRRVAELLDEPTQAGAHELHWDGMDVNGQRAPAGVYLVQAKAAERVVVTRVLLLPR